MIEVQCVYDQELSCRGKSTGQSIAFLHQHFSTVEDRKSWESIALWKGVSSVWEAGGSIPQHHEETSVDLLNVKDTLVQVEVQVLLCLSVSDCVGGQQQGFHTP